MLFPNAFKKVFTPTVTGGVLTPVAGGTKTEALTAGQIGIFDAKTYAAATAANIGSKPFMLVQGSLYASDKIGPYHGGYKESIKSKVINPKYISKYFKVAAKTAQNQIVEVSISNVMEDTTQRLRLDLKGSPALRFLSHNVYRTLAAFSGCAVNPDTPALVDPTTIAIKWAKELNEHPYIGEFISVAVKNTADATVAASAYDTFTPAGSITSSSTAKLVLTVAYADTKFGNATFTVTDHYELEPLFIYASGVDESGEPCTTQNITVAETQAARQASGAGETVLRDLILSMRYEQNVFHDSMRVDHLRMNEIEGHPALSTISRTGLYDQICILHNVPRFNNPSSTFDNDQYLLVIHVPTGTTTTALTAIIDAALTGAGNTQVALETF
jgi:hypothetical protein